MQGTAGFTLVELLVVISIIGMLVGLLLPAVQAAREAARRMQCQNNLHQVALATQMFHDTFQAYPPGRYQPRPGDVAERSCGGSEATWLVRIMPFIEEASAERAWDYSRKYGEHPEAVRKRSLSAYCCPSRRTVDKAVGLGQLTGATTTWITLPCGCRVPVTTQGSIAVAGALGDYGGNHGDLSPGSAGLPTDFYYGGNGTGIIISSRARCNGSAPVDWIDKIAVRSVIDGLSNTLLAGEMHVPIGKTGQAPEDAFIFNGDHVFNFSRIGGPTVPIASDLRAEGSGLAGWGSWHVGLCQFALADGSVRGLSVNIDTDTLGRLSNRHDGQAVALAP
jgi:prepilin-type N-terminal cleavage/methylation domain-containing protein